MSEQGEARDENWLLREGVPYAIFVHELDSGSVRLLNGRLEEILGHPHRDLSRDQMRSWTHPDDLAAGDLVWTRCGEGDTSSAEVEQRFRHADGSWRWLLTRLDVVHRRDDGRPTRLLGTASDVTHRRARETKQTESQKLDVVSRLSGSVAHDFNNFLTVILGNLALVLEKRGLDGEARHLLEEVIEVAQHAAIVTRQLLSFAHKEVVRPLPVHLNEIVESIQRVLRRLLPEKVRLEVSCEPEVGRVVIDPAQLALVILALVNNARDAMTDEGTLTIRTSRRRAGLRGDIVSEHPEESPCGVLSVSDTGGGMDQATVALIFEPFFSTKADRGSGLGLTSVREIVKGAGGQIRVRSARGRGTDVEIWLREVPCEGDEIGVRGNAARPRARPGKVLLVEDDPLVAKVARALLVGAGYDVVKAGDGEEGLSVFAAHEDAIGLVISDVMMPKLTGVEMAVRLRARRPTLPVVLMSGYTQDELEHPLGLGSVVFVPKPFTAQVLLQAVEKALVT